MRYAEEQHGVVKITWSLKRKNPIGPAALKEQKFLSPSRVLSSWTKNQIDMGQINGRKSNSIAYTQGIHPDMAIPKTVR